MKRLMKNVIQQSSRWAASQRIQNVFSRKGAKTQITTLSIAEDDIGVSSDSASFCRWSLYSQFAIHNPRSSSAFTLIEVMVAVAVVTMGIVAVLGLIPVSLKSARDAADNTQAATLAQDAFGDSRRSVLALLVWPVAAPLPSTTYWDAAGETRNLVLTPDGYFQVTLTWALSPLMPNSVLIVTATVTWPANAPVASQNSSVFVTEIARYNQ